MVSARTLIGMLSAALIAGCSSVPICGTVAAYDAIGKPCKSPSGALMGVPPSSGQSFIDFLADVNTLQSQGRNYVTNPITLQPQQPVQPNFNSFGNQGSDSYQLIMVNTPNGWVQKRCKVLKGQATACL